MTQEILFGQLEPKKKLEMIMAIPTNELLSYSMIDVMKRIIQECGEEKNVFHIKGDRQPGNNWNSTITDIQLYNGRLVVGVYIQSYSTDTDTTQDYHDILIGTERSYVDSRLGRVCYHSDDKANAVRAILSEYVYYKHYEADERERSRKLSVVQNYRIINPILNHYYSAWRLDKMPFEYSQTTSNGKRYYRCKKALNEYIESHVDELYEKNENELAEIYRLVFETESDK